MPELLAIMTSALCEPGHDFLGDIAIELDLLHKGGGQFFTPWPISSMMARIVLGDRSGIDKMIEGRGFLTLQEPACGAGGMILAAAEVCKDAGLDIGRQLFVVAIDVSRMAFNMTYLQLALSGIPALVQHGNTLSGETYDHGRTPAFFPFYAANRDEFGKWWNESPPPAKKYSTPAIDVPALIVAKRQRPGATQQQLTMF